MITDTEMMRQFGEVQGLLKAMQTQLAEQHAATNTRIEDMRRDVSQRFDFVEERLVILERGEKSLIAKTAGIGSFAGGVGGLLAAVATELIKKL